jgi:tetratricopeptide (TPR) repeat protein
LQWALLRDLQGEHDRAIAWLRRATDLDPGEFWPQWVLASWLERDGQHGEASAHAEAAMALRPRSARARELRDRLAPVDRATP